MGSGARSRRPIKSEASSDDSSNEADDLEPFSSCSERDPCSKSDYSSKDADVSTCASDRESRSSPLATCTISSAEPKESNKWSPALRHKCTAAQDAPQGAECC